MLKHQQMEINNNDIFCVIFILLTYFILILLFF